MLLLLNLGRKREREKGKFSVVFGLGISSGPDLLLLIFNASRGRRILIILLIISPPFSINNSFWIRAMRRGAEEGEEITLFIFSRRALESETVRTNFHR